jgi:hypothetical protein
MSADPNNDDWTELSELNFITAKQMIFICLTIALMTQTLAQLVNPTPWLNYQMLAFIMATNVAAVLLAIFAQKSAEDLSEIYKRAFTPDFYRTLETMTTFRSILVEQAERDGKGLEEDLEDLAPKLYGLLRKWIDVKAAEAMIEPPSVELEPAPEFEDDAELFN